MLVRCHNSSRNDEMDGFLTNEAISNFAQPMQDPYYSVYSRDIRVVPVGQRVIPLCGIDLQQGESGERRRH